MKHKKGKSSVTMKALEVPCTVFNPFCSQPIDKESTYNKYSNHTFSIENAAIYSEEKKEPTLDKHDSNMSKDSKISTVPKKVLRQPGFPLIIELKSKKNRNKAKKQKSSLLNMQYKPKFGADQSPVYSNLHGKVIYTMSAKLTKKVTVSIPKSIIGSENYPHPTIDSDVTVEVKDVVIHKKKRIKVNDDTNDIYEKEYNTTSERRRLKAIENEQLEHTSNPDQDQSDHADNEPNFEDGSEKDAEMADEAKLDIQVKEEPHEETKVAQSNQDVQAAEQIDNEEQTANHKQNNATDGNEQDKQSDQVAGQTHIDQDHVANNDNQDVDMAPADAENNIKAENSAHSPSKLDALNTETYQSPEKNENDQVNNEDTECKQDDAKGGAKSTPEKANDDDEESDEEYNGEGCFIGYRNTDVLRNLITTPSQRLSQWTEKLHHFKFITTKVRAKPAQLRISEFTSEHEKKEEYEEVVYRKIMSHKSITSSLKFTNSLYFPHKNLVQYDCGKLHRLSMLLKTLKAKGSKVLIFTQMTKMLDLLEQFLNLHGYTYVRLDGSVKVEMRQKLVDNFNLNKKIF